MGTVMALDPGIALSVRPIQLQDPLEAAGKAMTLRNLLNQGRIQEAELAQLPIKNQLALMKAQTEAKKAGIDFDNAKLDQIKKANEVLGGFAASVRSSGYSQQAWDQGKAFLRANGAPEELLANLPAQPDRTVVDGLAMRSLSVKDAIERGDYAALAEGQQTPGVQVKPMATTPQAAAVPLDGPDLNAPPVGVTRQAPVNTPEALRAKANDLRSLGTKAAFDEAKRLNDEANSIEARGTAQENVEISKERLELDRKQYENKLREDERKETELQKKRSEDQGKEYFLRADKLRDDFRRDSKTFVDMRDAYSRIEASAKSPSAAGDLAMIFNFMKLLDPSSVVREGEFATAQNAAGVPERIIAQYNRVIAGERLAPDTRADFLDRSRGLYDQALQNQKAIESQYRGFASRATVEPKDVVIDFRPQIKPEGKKAEAKESVFKSLPDPAKYKDKRMQGSDGTVYKSDGKKWLRQ